jgi:SRSO17 transposase
MTPADLRQSLPRFETFVQRFAPLLGDDSRPARAAAYLRGLLLDAESTKTAEAIALTVHGTPSQVRMTQVFLSQSPWPDQPLRHELACWVDAELGDANNGVLVVDESSFVKCGDKSVGVARQYCGSVGKLANGQVAVYLSYAGPGGHTLLDTRLYLGEDWAADEPRRQEAGVPADVVFRTKPELAAELLRQVGPLVRHGWVTFDEGYGKDPDFLRDLEERGEHYIGEVPKSVRGWLQRPVVEEPTLGRTGRPRHKTRVRPGEPAPQTAEAILAGLPATAWQRYTFREGSQGPQHAEFARVRFHVERDDLPGPELWLVFERRREQQTPVKYYLSNAERRCPLLTMVQVGHTRWTVEDSFLRGKQEVGLDDYEVRGWRGWHHHMTLSLLALWFLVLEQRRLGKKNVHRPDGA